MSGHLRLRCLIRILSRDIAQHQQTNLIAVISQQHAVAVPAIAGPGLVKDHNSGWMHAEVAFAQELCGMHLLVLQLTLHNCCIPLAISTNTEHAQVSHVDTL